MPGQKYLLYRILEVRVKKLVHKLGKHSSKLQASAIKPGEKLKKLRLELVVWFTDNSLVRGTVEPHFLDTCLIQTPY